MALSGRVVPRQSRLAQVLVSLVGLAAVGVMLWLGLWQMRVFEDAESASAAARATLPPVALVENIAADGTLTGDVYGRRVLVTGRYLPDQTLQVASGTGPRVLTAFALTDGRVLPVVRGLVPAAGEVPAPPEGSLELSGVFLPSEAAADPASADSPGIGLGSVRLAALAQLWPQQLLPGYLTLGSDLAASEGLQPATPVLPTQDDGPWRNAGYALQWWVFAAFAGFMTVRFVRAIGQDGTVGEPTQET